MQSCLGPLMATRTYQFTIIYSKTFNNFFQDLDTGQKCRDMKNMHITHYWQPPPPGQYKWNIDASKLESTDR